MAWLVVAMGVLLMLVGAMSVISGAPIIQIERGWAEVISGSVAASGGVIAFALGLVLFRLQSLQDAVTGRKPVVADTPGPAVVPQPVEAVQPVRTDEPSAAVAPPLHEPQEIIEPEAHPNLWKRVSAAPLAPLRPTLDPPAPPVAMEVDDEPSLGDREPPMPRTVEPERVRPPVNEAELRAPRLSFPPASRLDPLETARKPATVSRDWMSRPLLRPRPPEPPPSTEPPPLFAGLPGDLDEDRAPAIDASRHVDPVAPASAPRLEIEADEPTDTADPPPAVVGKYQAGSSTYTMYATGAIDVETENGDVHHFTSMDELKSFIARQENAAS